MRQLTHTHECQDGDASRRDLSLSLLVDESTVAAAVQNPTALADYHPLFRLFFLSVASLYFNYACICLVCTVCACVSCRERTRERERERLAARDCEIENCIERERERVREGRR